MLAWCSAYDVSGRLLLSLHQVLLPLLVRLTGSYGGSAAGHMVAQCVVEHGFGLYRWLRFTFWNAQMECWVVLYRRRGLGLPDKFCCQYMLLMVAELSWIWVVFLWFLILIITFIQKPIHSELSSICFGNCGQVFPPTVRVNLPSSVGSLLLAGI